jgi:Ca-activated chloride channel homolog
LPESLTDFPREPYNFSPRSNLGAPDLISMKQKTSLSATVLLCCLGSFLAIDTSGQPTSPIASPANEDSKEPIVVDVDLVNVVFSALDKKGKVIVDLTREEVEIRENDEIQTITNFTQESNVPLAIALLIDTSTSIRDKLKVEQEAAIDFFHSTIRRRIDRAMLISFDSTVDILQTFTDDADQLTKAVRRLKPGGGTKMFDAIRLACQEQFKKESAKRRVLVLISDGDDNMSFESLDSTLEAAQRADVSIYTISTNTSGFFGMASPKNDRILKRLAEETGGRAFFPNKIDEMAVNFQEISQELRNQYSLAYRSSNRKRDGAFRSIKIGTPRKNVRLQHRKGYYSPEG